MLLNSFHLRLDLTKEVPFRSANTDETIQKSDNPLGCRFEKMIGTLYLELTKNTSH